MFSNLSSSSISLATVTPSLVMRGAPKLLLDDDVAALRTERDLDRIGENVDAAQHLVARVGGKLTSLAAMWVLLTKCLVDDGGRARAQTAFVDAAALLVRPRARP